VAKGIGWPNKNFHVWSQENRDNRDHYRRRRFGNLQGCPRRDRYVYHGGSSALGGSSCRRTWNESPARWTLRHGSLRCKSAGCAFVQTIWDSMGIYRLPNRIVTGIWNDEAPAFAGLRRGRRMTCLRSATPKVFASRSTWQANDERSSNGQTRKATRGRVRTSKVRQLPDETE